MPTCQLSYRPCQPVNYVITDKPHIPLYSRLSVKAMIDDPSTCQLPYHSQTAHYLIHYFIAARSRIPP